MGKDKKTDRLWLKNEVARLTDKINGQQEVIKKLNENLRARREQLKEAENNFKVIVGEQDKELTRLKKQLKLKQ